MRRALGDSTRPRHGRRRRNKRREVPELDQRERPVTVRTSYAAALILVAVVAVPAILLFVFAPLCDPDVGWHLAFGRYIAEHGEVPTRDVLRFTPQEYPLHLHGWLSQLLFHLLNRVGGLHAFRVGTALVMLAALGVLGLLAYRATGSIHLALIAALLFLLTSFPVFHPRARIFTILFFPVAFERFALRREGLAYRELVWVFLGAVLWTNLHTEAIILPMLIGVVMVEDLFRRAPRSRLVSVAVSFVLSGLALFVSPYGSSWIADVSRNYQINEKWSDEWHSLFWLAKNRFLYARSSAEAQPMETYLMGVPYLLPLAIAIVAACVLAFILRPRDGQHRPGILVTLWAVYSAFNMVRFAWLLFIPTLVVLSTVAAWARSREWRNAERSWLRVAGFATVIGLSWITFRPVIRPDLWRRFDDEGWDANAFPTSAGAFVLAAGMRGNVLPGSNWGGYLTYVLPDSRVFMHGHWAEAPKTFEDYMAIVFWRNDMEQLLDRYDVTVLLVPSVWERRLRSAQWVRVFGNLESAVFVRTNDAAALAACAGYYARVGVPFSPSQGFDPKVAISAAPGWAREFRLIPR